jgi:hypothetical protein
MEGARRIVRAAWWTSLFFGVAGAQFLFLCTGRALAARDHTAGLLVPLALALVVAIAAQCRARPWAPFLLAAITSAVAFAARAGVLGLAPLAVHAWAAAAVAQIAALLPAVIEALPWRAHRGDAAGGRRMTTK